MLPIKRLSGGTLHVGLEPGRLTFAVRHGASFAGDRARIQQIDNASGHWQPVLNLLRTWLQQPGNFAQTLPVSVVLSSRWCRMMTVPWSDAILREDSAVRFLQSQYVALYGDEALGWTVTVDDAPYGHPRLACAVEGELLQSLHQLAAENKSQCRSVQPVVSAAWRAITRSSGLPAKAFAVIESDRLTLACADRGKITAVQSQSWENDWTGELARAWQRWMLRLPACGDIAHIPVLDLTGAAVKRELAAPFECALPPACGLEPGYGFVTCGRE